MAAALGLHILAATLWVGGMLNMLLVVRPVAVDLFAPADRVPFLTQALGRFFVLVWASIITLLISGYWMIFAVYGGMAGMHWTVHAMMALGILMVLVFVFLYFVPFRRLLSAADQGQWAEGAKQLKSIRNLVMVNAILGSVVMVLAVGGRYF